MCLCEQGLFSVLRHDGADDGGLGHAHAHKIAAERDCGGRSALLGATAPARAGSSVSLGRHNNLCEVAEGGRE